MRFIFARDNEFNIISSRLHDCRRAHKVFLPLDWRNVTNHAHSQLAIGRGVFSYAREFVDVDAIVDRN